MLSLMLSHPVPAARCGAERRGSFSTLARAGGRGCGRDVPGAGRGWVGTEALPDVH